MKKFLLIAFIIIAGGCVLSYMIVNGKPPTAKALVYKTSTIVPVTITFQPTGTPAPTMTSFPTVDYRATDQAYTLLMEQERNRAIEIQLKHDEEMLKNQVELARVYATGTAFGTEIAIQQAQLTSDAGMMTAQSNQLTATANAPTQIVAMNNSIRAVKNSKRDDIIFMIVAISFSFFAVSMGVFLFWKMRTITAADIARQEATTEYQPPEVPEGLTPYVREDHGSGDFTKWFVPCTPEQMTEIWELVVNGERNFAINRLETTTRTLRRPVLTKLRKWLRQNDFATELGAGEIALNDRFVAFVEKWGEDHELEEGYQFTPSPTGENV